MADKDFLKSVHPVYEACWQLWERNERRLRGGEGVTTQELQKFEWEELNGDHHSFRQRQATYLNFGDLFITDLLGHMMRQAPRVDTGLSFGQLGDVPRERNFTTPTEAELVYYNADGVGNDGSQWDNFWSNVVKMSAATGHRWIYVEAPKVPDGTVLTQADIIRGRRPYLIHWSPLCVTNWNFSEGSLEFAIVEVQRRQVQVSESGALDGNTGATWRYLMVREGFAGLGPDYVGGGWWLFNENDEVDSTGTWAKTGGQIPLFPHFYQRDEGTVLLRNTVRINRPAMSRPGIEELNNASVSYMNLSSAADFDAWDAAQSVQFLLGVDPEGFKSARDALASGSKWIPVPMNIESKSVPQVQDGSQGAVVATVFQMRLATKREEALNLAMQEVTSAPESSGVSKEMGFAQSKAPRLALIASELEQSQNTAIHFLEQRFGHAEPGGAVAWPREFDLEDLVTNISAHFDLEKKAGIASRTLDAKLLIDAAEERGLMTDDAEAKKIRAEYETPPPPPTDVPPTPAGSRPNTGGVA